MRAHTGERPYMRDKCSKGYVTKEKFEHHTRKIHTGERPYKCDKCHESFFKKHILENHILRHDVDKPHSCSICGPAYMYPGALKFYVKNKHKTSATSPGNALPQNNSEPTNATQQKNFADNVLLQTINDDILAYSDEDTPTDEPAAILPTKMSSLFDQSWK